ncbi:MAG TPA: hypothetical protein PLA94_02800 [Myxococcota bacterium]|nr:hypothetical protein [Myxococcota bacterium]
MTDHRLASRILPGWTFPVLLLGMGSACSGPPKDPFAASQQFLAGRPIYEQPLGDGRVVPEGLPSLSAASCGGCHTEIYAEWKVSTHAMAWVDPQLQAEMTKSENRWLCQNCHTPLQVQHAQLPVGLIDNDVEKPRWATNPHYDAALQQEGITCAACHVRDGVIQGPTGVKTSAHPTAKDESFLSADLCLRCHQAVAEYPGKTFTCTFRTGEEWAAGPYKNTPCQGCHMPAVERPSATGAASSTGHRHWFPGSGIPKFAGIEPPEGVFPPGVSASAAWTDGKIRLQLSNSQAGHRVPTGDPERFLLATVIFVDEKGVELGRQEERLGQTWEWWPTPKKLGDNRLAPGESRELVWEPPPGTTTARLSVGRYRMTEEAAKYHNLVDYPLGEVYWEQQLVAPGR